MMGRLGRGLALAGVLLALGGPAQAEEIVVNATIVDQARAEGTVGERYDGYLGFVKPVGEEVRRQVGKTNIKRRVLYGDVAAKRGVTRQDVGVAAGCQILARVAPGEYYLLNDNQWRQRKPAESAPRPSYCG